MSSHRSHLEFVFLCSVVSGTTLKCASCLVFYCFLGQDIRLNGHCGSTLISYLWFDEKCVAPLFLLIRDDREYQPGMSHKHIYVELSSTEIKGT